MHPPQHNNNNTTTTPPPTPQYQDAVEAATTRLRAELADRAEVLVRTQTAELEKELAKVRSENELLRTASPSTTAASAIR